MKKLLLVLLIFGMTGAVCFAQDFFIQNGTGGYTFYYIYVSDARSSDWGNDLLGRDVLRPGERFRITTLVPIDSTTWDIKIIDEDGDTYTIMRRRIRAGETIIITLADLD